jgi:hypothetical protein
VRLHRLNQGPVQRMAALATSRYTRWQFAHASDTSLVTALTASTFRLCDAL